MNVSPRPLRPFAPSFGKTALAVAFVALLGGVAGTPAYARDDHGRGWNQSHERGGDYRRHEWRGDRYGNYGYRPEYRRPYYYAQPVYVPPPVYYEPQRSPGINLFVPLDLRRR